MKKEFLNNLKGAADTSPQQQAVRNHVTGILRRNFESYGYLPLETAMLNPLDLLTYKYDANAEIVREIYKLRDQGDRDLGLRFDLTVPFCKFIAANPTLRMPFKRYEIGKVWRNGPVKSGRSREFYQCDVDAVGVTGVYIEAELISLAVKCYLEIGIEPRVKYGNRKLLPYSDAVIAVIDKMAKVSRAELVEDLKSYMTAAEAEKLLDAVQNAPKIPDIIELEKALEDLGVLKYCEYAPYLARGLNVYTGTVFEVFDKVGRIPSSLGGGGRYDKIIGNFIENGREYPAVGISFGLEPIMAVLGGGKPISESDGGQAGDINANSDNSEKSLVDLMLIPLGTEAFAQRCADDLRKQGKNVLVYLGAKNLAKAFEYAAAVGIKQCAVVGEDEMRGKPLVIKEVK